jgi:hypothetical protein
LYRGSKHKNRKWLDVWKYRVKKLTGRVWGAKTSHNNRFTLRALTGATGYEKPAAGLTNKTAIPRTETKSRRILTAKSKKKRPFYSFFSYFSDFAVFFLLIFCDIAGILGQENSYTFIVSLTSRT